MRQILLAMDSVKTMLLNRMDGHHMSDNRDGEDKTVSIAGFSRKNTGMKLGSYGIKFG